MNVSISTVSKITEILYVGHVVRKCEDFLKLNKKQKYSIKQILLENFQNIFTYKIIWCSHVQGENKRRIKILTHLQVAGFSLRYVV